jgi:L-ascorbate metabolism protein UlaG (beta-lactamase superfamily)
MIISWFGLSSFRFSGKDITIITDPFGSETGLSPVKGSADVVISTNPDNPWSNNFSSISNSPFIISSPGEFDIKGAFVTGIQAENKQLEGASTIYFLEIEDIRVAFIGPIQQNQLTEAQQEIMEGADIVLIPVGDKQVLSYEQAARISTQLEPFIVIPHSYKIPGLSMNLDGLDKFTKEMSGKPTTQEKLSVKKKDLSGESSQLIILTPMR